jgi:hypothetical protein
MPSTNGRLLVQQDFYREQQGSELPLLPLERMQMSYDRRQMLMDRMLLPPDQVERVQMPEERKQSAACNETSFRNRMQVRML